MSVRREEPLRRVRMSWDEFMALPPRPRNEWVDGEAVIVMAPVGFDHGDAVIQLSTLLGPLFPDYYVVSGVGTWLPRNRLRAPDVMLVDTRPEGPFVTEPALMVAEVLSRSTRSEDTIRKSMEYSAGGVGQYWIVDPEMRAIDVMRNVGGAWDPIAHLDEDHPTAEVELAGVRVPLDLRSILRA